MIFTNRESIEDSIIRLLSKGSNTPLALVKELGNEGHKASYQAVYKALKYLIIDTVVVKSGKEVAISHEWINKVSGKLNSSFILPPLAAGESVSYSYFSLAHLDAYWKHVNKALEQKYLGAPVFIYNPYGIWLHLSDRQESQLDYLGSFEKNKQYGFLVIGNDTALDRELKKVHQNDYLQIDLWKNSSLLETDYLTIHGDYIITTKLNKKLTPRITYLYKLNLDIYKAKPELEKVLKFSNRSKLKLEYNPEKANMLRKRLSKNFYIPPEVLAEHQLFEKIT
ncbi:MAG TPA: hypothetical protein PKA76_15410 [Pirellulaceae bacterium]|nr:hypothetical protein [Pirellulaceae bacterium]